VKTVTFTTEIPLYAHFIKIKWCNTYRHNYGCRRNLHWTMPSVGKSEGSEIFWKFQKANPWLVYMVPPEADVLRQYRFFIIWKINVLKVPRQLNGPV